MTREFENRRRDTFRFSARNQSSANGRYNQERSARPKRPRLNREIVDRAWQMGARLHHPDYQPRADLYGPSSYSTSTPPYRSSASWTPPQLNRSPQGQPNRRSRGRVAGTGNTGRAGGPGPRAQQGPRSHERELGGPSFSSHHNSNSRWQSGKPHREQPRPRGAPPSPRRQHGSTYGPDIESFKGGGKHNGVYEYDAPYPRSGNRHSPAPVNGFRSSPGTPRAARERGKAEKEKKNHSKRDKAFWEEISQETDHLLGHFSLNGHQPASSAEGYPTPPQPAAPDLPGSSQADDHPTGLETPDRTSAPQQQED
ncbi:hypothetical protein [Thermogemmatispora carboxidivorans]|uniref:hypothetical protein n=1 Tax=Thermogemmatispora carboxidivorans TaxID=1382306 RepID=UPI00069A68B8|nr:hypothetical protein [Thermogemmatispora carboxidivorans]